MWEAQYKNIYEEILLEDHIEVASTHTHTNFDKQDSLVLVIYIYIYICLKSDCALPEIFVCLSEMCGLLRSPGAAAWSKCMEPQTLVWNVRATVS